jgi:hypothetical protein
MRERIVPAVQFACLGIGALLVSMVALARLDGELGRQSAIADSAQSTRAPDQSLWSPERVRDYRASLGLVGGAPLAGTIGIVLLALGAGISLLRRRGQA